MGIEKHIIRVQEPHSKKRKFFISSKHLYRLLQTDIISKEYLEGCYKLGHLYPDLCSSIFLVCERGTPTEAAVSDRE